MRKTLNILAVGALATASLTAAAGGVPPAGRLLAAQCAQCHGTNGHSSSGIESLAGENATELYQNLLEMKYSTYNSIMVAHAQGYTDDELRLIADYFGSLNTNTTGSSSHE